MPRVCSVCRENYAEGVKAPVTLSCGHSFCRTCLQTLLQLTAALKCPVCRRIHSGAPLDQLPENVALLEELAQPAEEPGTGFMKLIIMNLVDLKFTLHVRPTDKFSQVKEHLCTHYGITPDFSRLIYRGRRLQDDRTPRDYDITDGTVIQMATCYEYGALGQFQVSVS
ncbi:tripartite motif-containing protein 75-like [Penaeus chinensis]|uniref:tripartite motif-containing protein 75-like n=1 Tax=Penaeus chinensis TaxID=139456 RepID=UPI001FB7DB9E|nr:tripartite motif-containing protein 75-like [Penaeus chinensis]